MANRAHRARRDTSEREITDVLTARGFSWRKIAQRGLPDLLVWIQHCDSPATSIWLVECKTGTGKLRETQQWDKIGLRVDVLRTAEEAMQWPPPLRAGGAPRVPNPRGLRCCASVERPRGEENRGAGGDGELVGRGAEHARERLRGRTCASLPHLCRAVAGGALRGGARHVMPPTRKNDRARAPRCCACRGFSRVLSTRHSEHVTTRRRECLSCGRRWTTHEHEIYPPIDTILPAKTRPN